MHLALSGVVVAIWVLASLTVFSESHLSALYPRYCSLAPPFPNRKTMLSGSGLAHQFKLVRIRDARALDAAPVRPDIVLVFVHGHHGGAGQGDTIAYATALAYAHDGKWVETYALDFNSGSSAFDASIAQVQIGFLREALRFLADQHAGVETVIIAHSMGGVVARAALAPTVADRHDHLMALITINSPLRMHPLLTDPKFASLYEIADDSLGLAVISIVGGHRDTMVPSTSGVLKPHAHLLTLFTASMPGVWTDLGHDDALSCTELWPPLISSIKAAANSTDGVADRIDTFRRRLQRSIVIEADAGRDEAAADPVVQVADGHVYQVLTPAALLSTGACQDLSASPAADFLEIPPPHESDHDRAKLEDFAGRLRKSTVPPPPAWSCMVTISDPVNITSPHPLSFGTVRALDLDLSLFSSRRHRLPVGTSAVLLSFTVRELWSSALWNGLIPAVLSLSVRRRDSIPSSVSAATRSPPIAELLVVQGDDPASGEMRWYRNPNPGVDVWRSTIAFHPGRSRTLRGRLALSPDQSYEVEIGIDPIGTLGAGLRLADKSSLISPFVSIIYYHIADLPHPILASIIALPLLSWASSKFAYDDDWSAPRFGIALNLILFWIGFSVLTLVAIAARLLVGLGRRSPVSVNVHNFVYPYLSQLAFVALLLTACFGPWSCTVALWLLVAAKWLRTPSSRFRAFVFGAYFAVVSLKATLIFAVWHQLMTTSSLSWVNVLTDSGPGLGAFVGNEMILALPIGLHLMLMFVNQGFPDEVDSGAGWLRMAAAFTCFVTLSSHYRLFEVIFATSLFAFCCCLEHMRFYVRASKGSPI